MPETTPLAFLASLVAARSEEELLESLRKLGRSLGFDQVLFGIEIRLPAMGKIQHIASGYPEPYQRLYQDRAFIGRDPAVAHCLTSDRPLIWTEQIYGPASYDVMEESRAYGLGHGLSVPVHDADSSVSMLSLGRDRPFDSQAERDRVLDDARVLAHCIHAAGRQLIVPGLLAQRRPPLSPREKECFQLVAQGKSNWDMGRILGISEAAAAFHVKNLLKKLHVSSRTQAVALGMALGMLTW